MSNIVNSPQKLGDIKHGTVLDSYNTVTKRNHRDPSKANYQEPKNKHEEGFGDWCPLSSTFKHRLHLDSTHTAKSKIFDGYSCRLNQNEPMDKHYLFQRVVSGIWIGKNEYFRSCHSMYISRNSKSIDTEQDPYVILYPKSYEICPAGLVSNDIWDMQTAVDYLDKVYDYIVNGIELIGGGVKKRVNKKGDYLDLRFKRDITTTSQLIHYIDRLRSMHKYGEQTLMSYMKAFSEKYKLVNDTPNVVFEVPKPIEYHPLDPSCNRGFKTQTEVKKYLMRMKVKYGYSREQLNAYFNAYGDNFEIVRDMFPKKKNDQ